MRNLKAETDNIRSRAESTRGCVKLKTVTKIRWSNVHNTFIALTDLAESVYFVLISWWDWEPVERLKQQI